MGKQRIYDFIQQGLEENPQPTLDKLKPLPQVNPFGTQQFLDSQKNESFTTSVKNGRKVKDFLPYVQDLDLNSDNLELERAKGQSVPEQINNAFAQFGGQFLGGAAMALGTTLDVEQSINTIKGTEKEYSNLLFDFGKNMIEKTAQSSPIYQKDEGSVSPSDFGWWANMFAQTGLSAGIMAESMAETAAISFLTEGTGLGAELAASAKKLRNIESLKTLIGAGDAGSKLRNAATMFGVINRHHEGIMEAADSFETEYKSLKEKGLSEEDAKNGAAQSAHATYLGNLPLMALDIAQFRAMTFNPISGGSTGGLVEKVLGGIKNPTLAKGIGHVFGALSEGGEEYWQALVQDEAKNYADNASGVGNGSKFSDRFSDFNKKGDTWNATISGIFGGVLLGGASHAFQKLTENGSRKQFNKEYDSFVQNISGIGSEMMNQIRELDESGDSVGANNLRRSMGVQKALHAVHLDNLKDSDSAFTSYNTYMNGILNAVNSNDTEQIKSLGVEGSEDFIKQNVPNYIADADKIQTIYNQVKQNNDRDSVVPITYRRFLQDRLSEESTTMGTKISSLEATMPDMSNLSNPGREINDASVNIQLMEAKVKRLNSDLKRDDLSDIDKEGIKNGILNLNFGIDKNKQIIEDQTKLSESVGPTQKMFDDEILKSVNRNADLQKLKENKVDVDTQLARVRKELNLWSEPEFQSKNQRAKTYDIINRSESIEDLNATESTLASQGVFTDDIRKTLQDKRNQLVAEQESKALSNNHPIETALPTSKESVEDYESTPSPIEQLVAKEMEPSKLAEPTSTTPFGDMFDINQTPLVPKSPERQAVIAELFRGPETNTPSVNPVGQTTNKSNQIMKTDLGLVNKEVQTSSGKLGKISSIDPNRTNMLNIIFNDGSRLSIDPSMTELFLSEDPGTKTGEPITALQNSEVSPQATVVDEASLFDPAPLADNISEAQREGITARMKDYYTSLAAELSRKPTFRELTDDMINNTSAEQVEKNFNLIRLGWELNSYPTTNFDKVYNDLFGTRKSKANDFFNFAQDSLATEAEYRQEQEKIDEQEQIDEAPPQQIEETETGQKVYLSTSRLQTIESNLKFAHLSQTYNETISENGDIILVDRQTNTDSLNESQFVDSKELMNPNLYGEGTKLKVKVPTEIDQVLLSQWTSNYQKAKPITYGEWVANKDVNSDEVIGRMPMIIYNGDKGVAFVHDVEWYNPINIGLGENPTRQKQIIEEAKAELMNFRRAVLANNGADIVITQKKPGTKITIPTNQPLVTITQANPQAKLGFVTDTGNINVGEDIISFEDLMNSAELDKGHMYDIRQSGLNSNGSKQYFASKVHYSVLDDTSKMNIAQAVRVYMAQFDTTGTLGQKSEIDAIRDKIKSGTKLDLFDQADFERYLNMFAQTYVGKAKTNKDIAMDMESNPGVLTGTPYIAISQGRLVFGIKGIRLSTSEANGYTLYMHPQNLTKDNATQFAQQAQAGMQRIMKNDFLGSMKQNMSKIHLENNTPVVNIDDSTTSTPYNDYLKSKLKTNLKSIKLDDGTYTSFTQPVIQFSYETEQKSVTPQGAEIQPTPQSVIQQVADKITAPIVTSTMTEADLIKSITDVMGDFENLGLTSEAMQAIKNLAGNSDIQFDPAYAALTDDIVKSIKSKLTKVSDLDVIDRNTVVQFIGNQIMTKIDPQNRNSLSKRELIRDINGSFNTIIAPKVKLIQDKIGALNQLIATGNYPQLTEVVSQMKNLENNANVLKANWNFLINEAFEDYVEKFTGIAVTMSRDQKTIDVAIKEEDASTELNEKEDDQQEFKIESSDQREKDYTKESVEDNGKASVGYLTKRFLAQIPNYDKQGNPKKGYMGITTYPGFDFYYDAIGKILSSPVEVGSNLEDMITRMEQHAEGKPWVREVIKRLSEADDQLKNAFMYNFTRHTLSMKFVMYSHDSKTNSYKLKVYDTNANEILRVIQTQWRENFKQSALSKLDGDSYIINSQKAQQLLDRFNSWTTPPAESEAKAWLAEFGIELSADSMSELYTKGYYVTENKKPVQYPYAKMFQKSGTTNGVFGLMAKYLEKMTYPGTNLNYQENDTINPFDDSSGILSKLANIESKYSLNITTNSFRDGSKSIFGYTPGKFATSFLNEIKNNPKVLEDKRQISFDQNSFLLDLISTDPDFSAKFSIDHLGINAFKELGKKIYQDNELNSLADADHELVKLGMFQDNQQGEVKSKTNNGLTLRMARMFLPTMSDKKTMLDIATAVLDLKAKHFIIDSESDNVVIDSDVKKFLFSQMVEPELKRIIAHHRRAKELGVNPNDLVNQKGYNMAAQIFNMIPSMNNIMFKGQTGEIRLIEYLANSAGMITPDIYNALVDSITEDTNNLLDDMFGKLSADKIASWDANGYFHRDNSGQISQIKYLNGSYVNSIQGTLTEKAKVAALDFVINSALTNANMHMLIAGDVANYSQDKAFKGRILESKPYMPVDNSVYTTMSESVVAVNLGKRLAMLIAPGSTIAQSRNDKYIQLFIQDRVSMSENIPFLIDLYYGKEARTEKVNADIELAKQDNLVGQEALKRLMKQFATIDAYFAIESTDAQEYTTTKEHLDILYRQGRVSVEQYTEFQSKIVEQKKAELEGRSIPESAILSDKDLKVIFQPIKPVYTGQLNDVPNNVSRMIYIKSSSFPLIPQMTSAFPGLNSLRKKMEQLESKTNKNVRASYDTANKVGAVLGKNQLQIWDENGNFLEDSINVDDIAQKLESGDDTSALVLDRNFFRIQQDVPFKSTKKEHQDAITVGTQMMKLFFGDGVGQITEPIFDGRDGVSLQDHYNQMFNNWIGGEKSRLYDSLGINEGTGEAIDKKKTIQKLQNILQQEAKKRGYPKQDVEALELDADSGDLKNIQFTIPLWLSPNSNRYEAMLNAIVTNRLLNLSLPGASFVAGSEEGFKLSEDISNIDQSKVIFTKAWTGELRAASDTNIAQALMPSKFRDSNGKLLDLLKKDDGGQYIYVSQADNGSYTLKDDMVDSELLSNSTFRIPTSSHVSLAQIEIVGFLPTESGDLMIVPKNFTKQKGLDFDVDKENVYMLHHTLDESGKLIPVDKQGFTYEDIKDDIQYISDSIEELRDKSDENRALIEQYQDEIEVNNQIGFDSKDAKAFIKELKADKSKADLKSAVSQLKYLKDLELKLYQNEIIRSYSSVLGSTDERIQKKINKVLSTDFAENQADLIEGLIRESADNSNFTILSDEFQKYKMSLGAAGKLGIGVYSNYVVLHSLIQQSSRPISLTEKKWNNQTESMETIPYQLNIGGIEFDGTLGKINTLDGGRSITDVNAERQNTATDNEKLQIMGKTNVNEITINADALLSLMGYDRAKAKAIINGKEQDVSVSYYLMSQPIIREYVDEIRKTKSNIAGYIPDAEANVVDDLIKKYNGAGKLTQQEILKLREGLTGQKLVDSIVDNGADGATQQVILELFRELKGFGEKISGLQSKLNIQRSGLGKSIFEMIEKYDNVSKLESIDGIDNVNALIGDYITGDNFYSYDTKDLIAQGYTIFDSDRSTFPFAVKPTTVTGSLVIHSAKAGYQLWSDYFPHQNPSLRKSIKDILSVISEEDVSETKKVQLQTEIFQDLKKYLYSSNQTGIFTGDPQVERKRLFMDTEGNQSLASYLNAFVKSDHINKELITQNKLTSRFNYTLEKGALPSLIKFDNSKSEDFNEEYKYMALVELMDKNKPLANYNGEPYTSRMLAKDLITYSYVQGGIQEAIEFVKYIPVGYLKEMGFADKTQLWQRAAGGEMISNGNGIIDVWALMLGTDSFGEGRGRFVTQYLQHNPQRLPKLTENDMEGKVFFDGKSTLLENVYSFSPKQNPEEIKPFISIYNKSVPKGKPKFQIYEYDGKMYNRISTLGVFGMSEYSNKVNDVVPLIDKHYPLNTLVGEALNQPRPKQEENIQESIFSLDENNLQKTLESIVESNLSGISTLVKALTPFIDNSTNIAVGDVNEGRSMGSYTRSTNEILIDRGHLKRASTNPELMAKTITHEYIHALTSRIISEHFNDDGSQKDSSTDLPVNMRRLQRLFRQMQTALGPELKEFSDWYSAGNYGQVRADRKTSDRELYAGLNIHEFTAMIMTETSLQARMSEVAYAQTDRSILQQFVDTIKKVLAELGINFREGSITSEAMNTIFDVIQDNQISNTTENSNPLAKFGIMSAQDEDLRGFLDAQDRDSLPDESEFMSPSTLQEEELDKDCIF